VIIAFGVATAGSNDPRIYLIVLCAALGAFAGDNLSYLIGRRFGPWATRRFFSGEKGAARRDWAERSLRRLRDRAHHRLPVHPRRAHGGDLVLRADQVLVAAVRRRHRRRGRRLGVVRVPRRAGRRQGIRGQPAGGIRGGAFGGVLVVSGLVEAIRRVVAWRKKKRDAKPPTA
jgi:hypothetical protein